MNTKITIRPLIHFDSDSSDAATGHGFSTEAFMAPRENGDASAAASFVEAMMEVILSDSPAIVASVLYGAALGFLELAGRPKAAQA
jgi:hypothetical protein